MALANRAKSIRVRMCFKVLLGEEEEYKDISPWNPSVSVILIRLLIITK